MEIIKKYIKYILRQYFIKKSKKYITTGNSILLNEFRVINVIGTSKKVFIGNDCMLDCKIIFESAEGYVSIGDRVFIGSSTIICRNNIVFENDIFVAWGTYFYDHDSHSLDYQERQKDLIRQLEDYRANRNFIESKDWSVVNSQPIKICSHAWIGMNCIILKGVTIGEGAIVGAGSIVTHNVPAWTVVAGNPAKVVKKIPSELRK
ncbi:MAG: acyltransferase [Bacteroidales bacterium]|jgi:galactoside O-acetyltransferase|nr:acyltransferase [Bacteroidales bacterium]